MAPTLSVAQSPKDRPVIIQLRGELRLEVRGSRVEAGFPAGSAVRCSPTWS
jgi:hypothetical protein